LGRKGSRTHPPTLQGGIGGGDRGTNNSQKGKPKLQPGSEDRNIGRNGVFSGVGFVGGKGRVSVLEEGLGVID